MQDLIPIVAMILVLGPVASWAFSATPIGRALAERVRGGAGGSDDRVLDLLDEVERLQEHVAQQDQRLEELHDRLDFTERLLARDAERPGDGDDRALAAGRRDRPPPGG